MKLTPREKDKLLVSLAAIVAKNRLSKGIKLNYPEAIAIISDFVIEGAREGKSVSELMEAGAHVISFKDTLLLSMLKYTNFFIIPISSIYI